MRYSAIGNKESKDTAMAVMLIMLLASQAFPSVPLKLPLVAVLLAAMAVPAVFKPAAFLWLNLSLALGSVMSRVLLSIVFLAIVVPVGVVRRTAGSDPLKLRQWKRGSSSVFTHRGTTITAKDVSTPY